LALKDADHIVRKTAYQIGKLCGGKSEQDVLDAILVLASPDKKRIEPQAHDGRRIKKVPEGWLVLNGEKYKALAQYEAKKARDRRSQAAFRNRKKVEKQSEPIDGESGVL
jgi:hypothetical protein